MNRGYETAAASMPSTRTPSREASPAIAPNMAMRWMKGTRDQPVPPGAEHQRDQPQAPGAHAQEGRHP
jgi:hypothetical protein